MEGGQGDSIVLEEEIDPNYEPTEKEVLEYATWLGMDLEAERDLFWIAREGLKAPLPENWKPCKTTDTEEIYYFNFASGQSTWDHPCDEFYRNLYEEHKKKRQPTDVQETDEKKKKVKEDVAELLGRKGSGKKKRASLAKAEPLGGPSLGKANPLEKKPLPGLSGRLGALGPSGLGGGGLRPVSGLGPLKSEAKDLGGSAMGLDRGGDDFKSDDLAKPLSRTPLGTVLGKKPVLSAPSTTATAAAGDANLNDALATSEFDGKRDRLAREHADKLRELQDAHGSELEALRKKLKAQLEDAQDAEEMKLKQLKREFDKRKNDMENQFDREENALQRSRKEQLKRLEAETDSALSRKRQDLYREFQSETDKLRLKHEAHQRGIQEDLEREAEKVKTLLGGKKEAAELARELKAEVDRLLAQQKSLEQELAASRSEGKALVQDKESLSKARDDALRAVDDLREQLTQVKQSESPAASPESCTKCPALEDRLSSLKREHSEELEELRKELEALQQDRAAAESKKDELVRGQEAVLKQEIASLQQQIASLEGESSQLKTKCAALQRKTDESSPAAAEGDGQLGELQTQLVAAQAELASAKVELADLQDQHAVILTTNAQIKEQLMKESNEGKTLREQVDSKTEAAQQFAAEAGVYQQKLQALQEQLKRETRDRQEQERTCDALRKEITALEQAKREADVQVSELEKFKSQLKAEAVDNNNDRLRVVDLEQEVERLQRQQRSLEQDLNALRREKETLVQDAGAAETQQHLVQCEVEELRKKLSELNQPASAVAAPQECSRCPVWEARVASLENERTEARTEGEKVRQELSELKQETRTRAAAERESLGAATAELQREKDDASRAFQHQEALLQQEIADLQQKLSTLEAESSELRAKCDVLQRQKDTAARRESAISSTASTTQDQLKILERRLAAAEAEATSTKSELHDLHDLQSQHGALVSEYSRAKEQLIQEAAEKKGLREQLEAGAKELTQRLASAAERHEQQLVSLQKQLESEARSRREREEAYDALRKEVQALEQAKRKADAELGQLESDKRHLESEKSMLALRLDELSTSRKRDEKSVMSVEEALADKKLEAEQLRASLKVVETDKEHAEARMKTLNLDFEQQVAKTHRLEAEYESERARSRTVEKERETATQRLQKLADELESSERRARTLAAEVSELQGLLAKVKASEQAATGRTEQATQKIRELEQQKERDEFATKMKLQQAEVEHESILHAKERADMQLQAREKELAAARDDVARRESEMASLQARVKSLLSDKEEVQAALLNANMVNSTRESAKSSGAATDVMLVKLQLADASRNELELHLADVSSQLDNATRRCASLEAQCRDQSVDIESLHVEVASLRSASQKMHLSALESLALVERLDYEHKKRTLRSDFLNQLRGFQEREEQALVRHKARLRAQYERHLEELVAELEKGRQQRVEQEEALSAQILQQIRQERDVKRTEAKRQVREELKQFEQELQERKARDIETVSKAIEQEEDELGARLREIRQVAREEELAKQLKSAGCEGKTEEAVLSRTAPRGNRRSQPESLDGDDDGASRVPPQSNQLQHSEGLDRPARRQKRSVKTYEKWKRRLQEEVALLVNARTLVANQRQGLTKQARQLKESKSEWKRHSRTTQANPIQREVKRMLDENMANWSQGMRKLRRQEAWVKQREQKLAKMKRTVERLRRKHRDAFDRGNNLSGRSESSSDEDDEDARAQWSDYSNESELTSTLKKLQRLEEELASDAGSFSEAEDLDAYYQVPSGYAGQREAPYRYPLTPSLGPFRAMHAGAELAGPDTRWLRSQRTAFGLRGDRFAVTPAAHSASRSEQVYQQKISRWARGREKVQHAATNHATWLSGLCEEMKEYGATYSRAEGGLDSAVQFVQDEEKG